MFLSRRISRFLANYLVFLMLLGNPATMMAVSAADSQDTNVMDTTLKVDKTSDVTTTNVDSYNNLTNREKTVTLSNSYLKDYLANDKKNGPNWLKNTDIQFLFAEDGKPVYSLETLQPFGSVTENGQLWFWQGRYAHDEDTQNTANLGFGWRKLSADKTSMIGFNTFYDYGFQYNLARVGLGTEYFNKLAEFRANWYYPVSGDRQTGVSYLSDGILYSYIRAVEGVDFEAGTSFTHIPWLKVFAGGYYWDNKYNPDEKGYRLRSTMQLAPRVNMELGYTDSNLSHGLYGDLKYQLAFVSGPSAFGNSKNQTISTNDLTEKLLQKVERENDIKTETYTKFVAYTGNIKTTVTNSTNSTALAGATVQAYQNGSAIGSSATTDSSGNATISGLAVGTYTVYVTYGSYNGTSSSVTVTKDTTASASVSLAVSGGSATVTVLNAQSVAVSGVIVVATLSSTTVAAVERSLIDTVLGMKTAYAGTSSFSVSATTGANGMAYFTNLPPGAYTFKATSNSYSIVSESVTVPSGGSGNTTMMLPGSGGDIHVVVKDASGSAISGAAVKVLSGAITVATGTTNSNGVAIIGGVAAGSYTVSASLTNYTSGNPAAVTVSDGNTAVANLMLTQQTGSVSVTVNFNDNNPLNEVPSFYVDGSNTSYVSVTANNGTYTLSGLSVGVQHSIKVSAANYSSSTDTTALTVTPSATSTVSAGAVALTRQTGNVTVSVTFSDSNPLSETPSFYVDGSSTALASGSVAVSGSTYTLSGLTANVSHTIKVSAANYSSTTDSTSLTVTPSATSTVNAGTVTLTPQNQSITIQAQDGAGNNIQATLSISFTNTNTHTTYNGTLNASGQVTVSMPFGKYNTILQDTLHTSTAAVNVTIASQASTVGYAIAYYSSIIGVNQTANNFGVSSICTSDYMYDIMLALSQNGIGTSTENISIYLAADCGDLVDANGQFYSTTWSAQGEHAIKVVYTSQGTTVSIQ